MFCLQHEEKNIRRVLAHFAHRCDAQRCGRQIREHRRSLLAFDSPVVVCRPAYESIKRLPETVDSMGPGRDQSGGGAEQIPPLLAASLLMAVAMATTTTATTSIDICSLARGADGFVDVMANASSSSSSSNGMMLATATDCVISGDVRIFLPAYRAAFSEATAQPPLYVTSIILSGVSILGDVVLLGGDGVLVAGSVEMVVENSNVTATLAAFDVRVNVVDASFIFQRTNLSSHARALCFFATTLENVDVTTLLGWYYHINITIVRCDIGIDQGNVHEQATMGVMSVMYDIEPTTAAGGRNIPLLNQSALLVSDTKIHLGTRDVYRYWPMLLSPVGPIEDTSWQLVGLRIDAPRTSRIAVLSMRGVSRSVVRVINVAVSVNIVIQFVIVDCPNGMTRSNLSVIGLAVQSTNVGSFEQSGSTVLVLGGGVSESTIVMDDCDVNVKGGALFFAQVVGGDTATRQLCHDVTIMIRNNHVIHYLSYRCFGHVVVVAGMAASSSSSRVIVTNNTFVVSQSFVRAMLFHDLDGVSIDVSDNRLSYGGEFNCVFCTGGTYIRNVKVSFRENTIVNYGQLLLETYFFEWPVAVINATLDVQADESTVVLFTQSDRAAFRFGDLNNVRLTVSCRRLRWLNFLPRGLNAFLWFQGRVRDSIIQVSGVNLVANFNSAWLRFVGSEVSGSDVQLIDSTAVTACLRVLEILVPVNRTSFTSTNVNVSSTSASCPEFTSGFMLFLTRSVSLVDSNITDTTVLVNRVNLAFAGDGYFLGIDRFVHGVSTFVIDDVSSIGSPRLELIGWRNITIFAAAPPAVTALNTRPPQQQGRTTRVWLRCVSIAIATKLNETAQPFLTDYGCPPPALACEAIDCVLLSLGATPHSEKCAIFSCQAAITVSPTLQTTSATTTRSLSVAMMTMSPTSTLDKATHREVVPTKTMDRPTVGGRGRDWRGSRTASRWTAAPPRTSVVGTVLSTTSGRIDVTTASPPPHATTRALKRSVSVTRRTRGTALATVVVSPAVLGRGRAFQYAVSGAGAAAAVASAFRMSASASVASKATQLSRTLQLATCQTAGAANDGVDDVSFVWTRDVSTWQPSARLALWSTTAAIVITAAAAAVAAVRVKPLAAVAAAVLAYYGPNVCGLAPRAGDPVGAAVALSVGVGAVAAAGLVTVRWWNNGEGRWARTVHYLVDGAREPESSALRRLHGVIDVGVGVAAAVVSGVPYRTPGGCIVASIVVASLYGGQVIYLVKLAPLVNQIDFIAAVANAAGMLTLALAATVAVGTGSSFLVSLTVYLAFGLVTLLYGQLVLEVGLALRRRCTTAKPRTARTAGSGADDVPISASSEDVSIHPLLPAVVARPPMIVEGGAPMLLVTDQPNAATASTVAVPVTQKTILNPLSV